MSNNDPTQTASWTALAAHQKTLQDTHIKDLFDQDVNRFSDLHIAMDGVLFDYSRHHITQDTLALLVDLAQNMDVAGWRDKMFAGKAINTSEDRAAWHVAARNPDFIGDKNLRRDVEHVFEQIKTLSETLRANQTCRDIVHIGIGGSDLGPAMVCRALEHFSDGPNIHFVSNIDGAHLHQTLKHLSPDSTRFIISSKTFSTLETLSNAKAAKDWAGDSSHFIAVTAHPDKAQAFGIAKENIIPQFEWIGGRFSLWVSGGLAIAIATGFENFKRLLDGAQAIDTHFKDAPMANNIPVLMGLLSIWYRNFWDHRAQAIIPYAQNLELFPGYLQQIAMESNGKNISRDGRAITHKTAPVLFGQPGSNAQHAFFQMLHQGSDIIPCDFIGFRRADHPYQDHHRKLLGNMLAQSATLMHGDETAGESYKTFPGNRPSSTLILERLDPYHTGMLLALYEHKTFVEGVLWGINSFDQWGVELGKTIAKDVINAVQAQTTDMAFDSSTNGLLNHLLKGKK